MTSGLSATGSADARDGGLAARRAMARWAIRLFRREWRQQALVLTLLTLAVGAAIFSSTAAHNLAQFDGTAEFGSANQFWRLEASDSKQLDSELARAEEALGPLDVIYRWEVRVPGSAETVEFRAQDPDGPYSAPMLSLLEGRYPGPGEVALTDGVAGIFEVAIGDSFALDGVRRTVVGFVETPGDLDVEFTLVAPSETDKAETATVLARVSPEAARGFQFAADNVTVGTRSDTPPALAAITMLGVASVAMLLVSLIAAGSFVVIAQRRLRQLGMLSAIGASEVNVRFVVMANGAAVGIVSALVGATLGVATWVLSAPRLEQPAGRRLDMTNLPWWLIASAIALAIVGATAAAWWPARSVARVPTMLALSGRPPRPAPARGWLPLAVALVTLGVVALGVAEPEENLLGAFMMMFGVIASVLGLLLFSPVAIRALAATARWFPVAVRLALRDLARYQARSGFALAAVSLALGIPLALVVTATVAEHSAAEGNLSSQQLLIRPGDPADPDGPCPGPVQSGVGGAWWTNSSGPCPFVPARVTDDLSRLEAVVGDIARLAGQSEVMTLDVAVDPAMPVGPEGYQVVTLASDIGDVGLIDVSLLFVATPALLAHYGVELTEVPSTTEFLTVVTGDLKLTGAVDPDTGRFVPRRLQNVHQLSRGYTSLPGTFITPDALRDHGWDTVRAGWLLEMDRPLADDEFAIARDMAVDAGVIIERRDEQQNLASLRTRATGAAVAVALSVLAMTVGLIRAEAANELRTLAATGATSRIRRSLTAATTGAMAFLGVALAMAGTYLVVGALRFGDLGDLAQVPVLHLAVIAVGVPLAATVGGWLLAGREPASLARQPLE